jgi:hypothetical protein
MAARSWWKTPQNYTTNDDTRMSPLLYSLRLRLTPARGARSLPGYSGTPLAKKLGIKPDSVVLAIGAPDDYGALLKPMPEGAAIVAKAKPGTADIVHLFVPSLAALEKQLPQARQAMTTDGAIWISWYKKSAKVETDVTEDAIRARALKTDLVDVKVCAVTDIWSGLKLVVRKHLR